MSGTYPSPTFAALTLQAALSQGNGGTGATAIGPATLSRPLLVSTISALQALTTTTCTESVVSVAGYRSSGDGGGGLYVRGTSTTANGGTIINDASSRSWYLLTYGQPVSVCVFGADKTGSSDSSAAFASAFAANVPLLIPAGIFLLNSAQTITNSYTSLIGLGQLSVIKIGFATGDIFTVGNGTSQIDGCLFQNFHVQAAVQRTSGACFHVIMGQECWFYNVDVGTIDDWGAAGDTSYHYDGIFFDRFSICGVMGGESWVSNAGIKCCGNSNQTFGAELTIDGGWFSGNGSAKAVWIGGAAGGVYVNRTEINLGQYGVYIDTSLVSGGTAANREVFLNPGCIIDTNSNWGIYVANASVSFLQIVGVWCCGNGTNSASTGGMFINTSSGLVPDVIVSGCRFYRNQYDGIVIANAALTLTGSTVEQSGYVESESGYGANGGNGLYLSSAGLSTSLVAGNSFLSNGNSTRGYGVTIPNSLDSPFLLNDNLFSGNGQAAIYATPPLGPSTMVANNVGYASANAGNATVATSATTVTVNHGLAQTPNNVLIGPLSSQAVTYTLGSVGSTSFTLTISSAASSPGWSFYWRASFGGS